MSHHFYFIFAFHIIHPLMNMMWHKFLFTGSTVNEETNSSNWPNIVKYNDDDDKCRAHLNNSAALNLHGRRSTQDHFS